MYAVYFIAKSTLNSKIVLDFTFPFKKMDFKVTRLINFVPKIVEKIQMIKYKDRYRAYYTLFFFLLLSLRGMGQGFTDWTTVYSDGSSPNEIKVQISFKVTGCDGSLSYFRVNNLFSAKGIVQFKFDYTNCEGKLKTEYVSANLEHIGITESGYWFIGSSVGKVYDVKASIYNSLDNNKDFKEKFTSLYDGWKKDLARSILQYEEVIGNPDYNTLSVTREWGENIQKAARRIEVLKDFNERYFNPNNTIRTQEFENDLNSFTSDYKTFQRETESFQSKIRATPTTKSKAENKSDSSLRKKENNPYNLYPVQKN